MLLAREDFGFGESLELTRGIFSRAGPPWLGVMLALFGVVKITGLLYDALRSIVVSILPSIVTVYVYSVAFHMAVLMALIVIQAIYASWIAPRLSASTPAGGWDAMTPDRISRRMRPVGYERSEEGEAPTPAAIDRALRRRNSGADS